MEDRRFRPALFALVEVAEEMLDGVIGSIEGSRRIVRLKPNAGDLDDEAFLPFVGIDSESEDIIIGEGRALWSDEFLKRSDQQCEAYEDALRPGIGEDCRALLEMLQARLRECPICRYAGLARPPYDAVGTPSYETCGSCGYKFGITDAIGYDFAEWRRRWIRDEGGRRKKIDEYAMTEDESDDCEE